jgi:hypothetical protein
MIINRNKFLNNFYIFFTPIQQKEPAFLQTCLFTGHRHLYQTVLNLVAKELESPGNSDEQLLMERQVV